jgi:hypothetical protein
MNKNFYQLDEVGTTLLITLKKCGTHKTFAEILDESGINKSEEEQTELADVLEKMKLIESVSYRLPFEIRAELSSSGIALVDNFQKKINARRALRPTRSQPPRLSRNLTRLSHQVRSEFLYIIYCYTTWQNYVFTPNST